MSIRIRRTSGAPVVLGEETQPGRDGAPTGKQQTSKPAARGAGSKKPKRSSKSPASKKTGASSREGARPARGTEKTSKTASQPSGKRKKKGAQPTLFETGDAPPKRSRRTAVTAPEPAAVAPETTDAETAPARPSEPATRSAPPRRRATAESMAQKQREISVSEFFMKNRHLLGFDSPARALLTTVKEALDNSLDAAEEAGILPSITVELVELAEDRYRVIVEDNGPGIVKAQVPKVFGKLLYGSKFHRLRQSLTADQPVLVERDGRVQRTRIGELVDAFLGEGEEVRDVSRLGLRVPAFDPKSWVYDWRPVSHVIRHERANEILEVTTECGKRVRVTGCHSLFGYDATRHAVRAIEARLLRPGDSIVAPRRIPAPAQSLGEERTQSWMDVGVSQRADCSTLEASAEVSGVAVALQEARNSTGHRRIDESDLCLARVRAVEVVETEDRFVYDLSVPGCENFVAGEGPLACHNSRGQQGIGISAAGMYGQLTTGKPIVITSKTGKGKPAHHFEIVIDTTRNTPNIVRDETIEWDREHGTRIEIELQGTYKAGRRSVDEYVEQVAIANPHAEITYKPPKGREPVRVERATTELPREPLEIKPHPYGVELGMLQRILQEAEARTVSSALQSEFSRVTPKVADEILKLAGIGPRTKPGALRPGEIERLHKVIPKVKIFAPPTACVVPIGEDLIRKGLEREIEADFYTSTTRPPAVYRGNPFQVEAGLAYGGSLRSGDDDDEESVHATRKDLDSQQGPITLLRLANRVPLQYQQSACSTFKAVVDTTWRSYGLSQPRGSLPQGPMVLLVHIASVWVPFTSESKEAVAHYPEILKEMQLALQDCGRKLGTFLRKREAERHEQRRRSIFEMYVGELVESLGKLTKADRKKLQADLLLLVRKHTGDEDEDVQAMVAATRRVAKRDDQLDEDERESNSDFDTPSAGGRSKARARGAAGKSKPAPKGKSSRPAPAPAPKAGRKKAGRGRNNQLELLGDE